MKVNFIDESVRGRCRALVLMDELEFRKIRVENGRGRYYGYLIKHGFIEQQYPFRPVNEYNSYRLTARGATMKKILLAVGGNEMGLWNYSQQENRQDLR